MKMKMIDLKEFLKYYFETYNDYYKDKDKEYLDVSEVKKYILSCCRIYLTKDGKLILEVGYEYKMVDVLDQYNDFKLLKRKENLDKILNDREYEKIIKRK